ncbi:hypothetical protein CEXT_311291 [Caerostris extrusa]|uniref:Uncharacterized protein n=1 Tax=Caerostris extrusa TaxID=172846 RepID=A0AAV4NVF3_CAEEX|nr:hypothetical protein CEXT_311291 [Caerostris extrusa]
MHRRLKSDPVDEISPFTSYLLWQRATASPPLCICKRKYVPHAEKKQEDKSFHKHYFLRMLLLPLSLLGKGGIDAAKRAAAFSKKALFFSLFRVGGLPKWGSNRQFCDLQTKSLMLSRQFPNFKQALNIDSSIHYKSI